MRVTVRNNNVDKAMRVLKNKLQQEGFFNELREREYYMTRGEKRRKAKQLQFVELKNHLKKDTVSWDTNETIYG